MTADEELAAVKRIGAMPAFPRPAHEHPQHGGAILGAPGMTLRQYAAVAALQGLLSNIDAMRAAGWRDYEIELFAVKRADTLLAELAKRPVE